MPSQWRHYGRDSVSNHQLHDCLLNRLFRRRSKKTSKLRVTGLCAANSTGDRWIPRTNGQLHGKCFHLITSSCWTECIIKCVHLTRILQCTVPITGQYSVSLKSEQGTQNSRSHGKSHGKCKYGIGHSENYVKRDKFQHRQMSWYHFGLFRKISFPPHNIHSVFNGKSRPEGPSFQTGSFAVNVLNPVYTYNYIITYDYNKGYVGTYSGSHGKSYYMYLKCRPKSRNHHLV